MIMETPTFEQWLKKYFNEPKMKLMYKSNMQGDSREYNHEYLMKRYDRAYHNTGYKTK